MKKCENENTVKHTEAAEKRRIFTRSRVITPDSMDRCSKTNLFPVEEIVRTNSSDSFDEDNIAVFPSLPDNFLKALSMFGKCNINKNLNEPDIEEKFARLSLAFKTDKFTLSKRLELQQRQRDIAEKNIDSELKALRESLNALNQLCTDSDMREVITKTQQHVDIVQQATTRMSSRAETYGAIQQEQRMNSAFETMLNYVEHLKLIYDKEHIELEEYRRLLAEHNLLPEEKGAVEGIDDAKRVLPPRSHSLSGTTKPEQRTRLLSAVCLLSNNFEGNKSTNGSNIPLNISLSPKSRRASLPVGPVSHISVNPNSFSQMSPLSNRNHNGINEHTEILKDEEEKNDESEEKSDMCMEPDFMSQSADNDQDVPILHESVYSCDTAASSSANNDSSIVEAAPLTYCDDNCNTITDIYIFPCKRFDNQIFSFYKKIHIPERVKVSLHKIIDWIIRQRLLNWNSATAFKHFRYFLSATFAIAAVLSLIVTFMPNYIMASSYIS